MFNNETDERLIVRIDGEPFLSRAKAYRDKQLAVHQVWRDFGDKLPGGRDAIEGLTKHAVKFKGKPPAGWTVPRRGGYSSPKMNNPIRKEMLALPDAPRAYEVFGDWYCEDYTVKVNGEIVESGGIGFMFTGPRIGWAGDTFFAVIADPRKAKARILADYPDGQINDKVLNWTLAPGLVEISEAEKNLIVASYQVEQERAQKAAA